LRDPVVTEKPTSIPHKLSLAIQRSHSLQEILDSCVEMVAEQMQGDVCSIYLLDPGGRRLRLMASQGLASAAVGKVALKPGEGLTGIVVQEMRSLAVDDASQHPGYLYFPETREERFKSFLGVPMAMRNRPVGAIVVQTIDTRMYTQSDIETLGAMAAQLVGVVENARLIEALDRGDEDSQFLDDVRRWGTPARPSDEPLPPDTTFEGTAASRGVATAPVVVRGTDELSLDDAEHEFQGEEAEKARFLDALEQTRLDIVEIQRAAERETDEEHALIFSSHLLLLNDPVLRSRINDAIESGNCAHIAVRDSLEEFERRLLDVSDPYIQERVEDIRDLRGRLIGHLLRPGDKGPQLRDRIVVAVGIPPSLVVELKAEGAKGLVTERGGTTSHGALLARSMGIPAVTGVVGLASRVRSGDLIVVDGDEGKVILNPSAKTEKEYTERTKHAERLRTEYLVYRDRPAQTADQIRIELNANIGVAADLETARENGADGVGLYRTEFPFLVREQFPTREEQVRIYSHAYEIFPEGKINFRLLDLGGDKFLRGGAISVDRSPFASYRSVRVLLDHPQVVRDQVQAFALAAGNRPINVLVPMISNVEEVRRIRVLVSEALAALPDASVYKRPRLGIMIELPAAVEIARALAKEVDFFSIGTNDLIQFTLAVDRENSRVSSRADSFHPAILNMLHRTIEAAHAEGKPVGVCGELANDRLLAGLLIAMEVDSLSVTPSAIPELKQALAVMKVRRLEEHIPDLLALGDGTAVEEQLANLLG
jgi:phosphotransferase system enzyme I (PtsP)